MEHHEPGSFREKFSSAMLAKRLFGESLNGPMLLPDTPYLAAAIRDNRVCYSFISFEDKYHCRDLFSRDRIESEMKWVWPIFSVGE